MYLVISFTANLCVHSGQFINSYQHLDSVYCVACHPSSPSLVFTSSEDGCVYIIDTRMPGNRCKFLMVNKTLAR